MNKHYIVNCYTCQHNGQETCKGCNTLLVGEDEPYENWQLREDLEQKDQQITELKKQLQNAIIPKFKVGQIVYTFNKSTNCIYELCIKTIRIERHEFSKYNHMIYFAERLEDGNFFGYFEVELFATKEEAEAKLNELKGE